jgi:hypothetical protein
MKTPDFAWRSRPDYIPPNIEKLAMRPGALDMLRIPSLIGAHRIYPKLEGGKK